MTPSQNESITLLPGGGAEIMKKKKAPDEVFYHQQCCSFSAPIFKITLHTIHFYKLWVLKNAKCDIQVPL